MTDPRRLCALGYPAVLACALAACQPGGTTEATSPQPLPGAQWPLANKELQVRREHPGSGVTPEPIVGLMQGELQRAFTALSKLQPAVYFLSYQLTDQAMLRLGAAHGALFAPGDQRMRIVDVDLRIGSQERDDRWPIPGEPSGYYGAVRRLPLDDDEAAVRNTLWLATDEEYHSARMRWLRVQSASQADEEKKPSSASFSKETPVVHAEPRLTTTVDQDAWERQLRALSRVAADFPEAQDSSVGLNVLTETRYLVTTEGTALQTSHRSVRLEFQVQAVAQDGMLLERFDSVDVHSLEALPSLAVLEARFRALFKDVRALLAAPLIDPYVGPAILDGRAAGVFMHEVFGHRIEGHRQDAEREGQTFAAMIGQEVVNPIVDIYDDPSASALNGVALNGFYLFDDEGVRGERVLLVENGVLRGFLLSRTPVRGFTQSNGHGRRQPGYSVVARQANLVIEPSQVVSRETLKQILLDQVTRQGLPYGLRFSEVVGGFTQTERVDTQAFKVMPVMVYRIYPDGQEELVRGVDIEGTPLTALSKVTALANDFQVFNGVCGAESGWVPVSATSPSVLLSQVEVARQEQGEAKPPVLPPPPATAKRRATASQSDSQRLDERLQP